MRTVCCSCICEKRFECANNIINNHGGIHYSEDFYSFGSASISSVRYQENWSCGELGNWRMFTPIQKKTDYEQWKEWLGKWNVEYEEKTWNPNVKELIVGGSYCQASIVFDLEDHFVCITAYE